MNEIARSVGTRIRSLRKAPGLSQSETAEGTGLTFRQAQMCGNGANRIAQSRLWTIADSLRLSGGARLQDLGAARSHPGETAGPMDRTLRLSQHNRKDVVTCALSLAAALAATASGVPHSESA